MSLSSIYDDSYDLHEQIWNTKCLLYTLIEMNTSNNDFKGLFSIEIKQLIEKLHQYESQLQKINKFFN